MGTTATVSDVTATFDPAAYRYGYVACGGRGLIAEVAVSGTLQVSPVPVACVYMIVSAEIVVTGATYKRTLYIERIRTHFVP
jgi:hypothetical protein